MVWDVSSYCSRRLNNSKEDWLKGRLAFDQYSWILKTGNVQGLSDCLKINLWILSELHLLENSPCVLADDPLNFLHELGCKAASILDCEWRGVHS